MSRIAYVNGAYCPHREGFVHIEDRGYQFADGVYEVWGVRNKKLLDFDLHITRLIRSLGELQIEFVHSTASLKIILTEIIRRNRIVDGMVYLQITRGVAPRDHAWPDGLLPSLVITAKSIDWAAQSRKAMTGVAVITVPDIRWQRRDIKSTSLLPNVLAKQQAYDQGAYEAWLVDEQGFVTEGTSTNAWIVTQDNLLITRNISSQILSGVTRLSLLELAQKHQISFEERAFTVSEAKQANEAFISAATTMVMPVVQIDGVSIATGKPGPIARLLRQAYLQHAEN